MSNHIPFLVLKSGNISRKFVTKKMRSCDKNFGQLHVNYENDYDVKKDNNCDHIRVVNRSNDRHCYRKNKYER